VHSVTVITIVHSVTVITIVHCIYTVTVSNTVHSAKTYGVKVDTVYHTHGTIYGLKEMSANLKK
jgi:hypothetical protein